MSIQSLTTRVARLHAKLQPSLQTILLLHEEGCETYTLSMDGSQVDQAYLDKMQEQGHTLFIEDYPRGYLGDLLSTN